MKWQQYKLFLTTSTFALLFLFSGCGLFRPSYKTGPPPPSIQNPSVYPNSQNIQTSRPPNEADPNISFEVSDEPDKVLDY